MTQFPDSVRLIVLRTTHMPAVLLEAGSIINRKEELELAKPQRVALVADAATHAVETYCDAHSHYIAEAPSHPAHASGQTVRPAARVYSSEISQASGAHSN